MFLPESRGADAVCPGCGSPTSPPDGHLAEEFRCPRCGRQFLAGPLTAQERAVRRMPGAVRILSALLALGLGLLLALTVWSILFSP